MLQEILRQRKMELGITTPQLSEKCGVPFSTVQNIFSKDSKNPSVYTIGPIASALGISLDAYFGIEPQLHDGPEKETENAVLREQRDNAMRQAQLSHNAYLSKNTTVVALSVSLALFLFLGTVYFIFADVLNPNFGIVRYDIAEPAVGIVKGMAVAVLAVAAVIGVIRYLVSRTIKKFDL